MVSTGLANAVVTGVVTGSIVALGAIGLALVYSIAEVPNFAHGELLMIGAYVALTVNRPSTVPVFEALAPGAQALSVAGFAVLFLVSAGAFLAAVYLLGGRESLRGSWWPLDVSPAVAAGLTLAAAAAVGTLVVVAFPSLWGGVLLSALVLAILAPLFERYVFRPFRERGVTLATMLIVALGLDFVLRFGTQAVYGGQTRRYEVPDVGTVFGRDLVLAAARFFDIYVHGGGLVVEVLDTARQGNPRMALFAYGWPRLVAVVGLTAVAAVAAYRWRDRGPYASGTLGPKLAGAIAGVVALGASLVVLAGGGEVPADPAYATRVRLSILRASVVVVALAMMGSLHVLLQETKLGTAMRAASDNKDLARVTGINTDRVMMSTWMLAGAYAAVGGVMLGVLLNVVNINMGFFLLLPMFAAVILGGIGSVYGAILGSFLVGLTMDVGIFLLDIGATYRVPMAFVVLFVVLLVKPEGIVGGG